ncbi:hypothetical protein NHH03_04705 [Stieleria sp. TO1_6]|uniref:hypothetical protein n=1 Tax=Stieleria tagensis TaxID=2956795 RepID=UPI00209B07C8|nr:hypothetical protein [Stieleria tagensis]MCO8121028.1 hypothetical protein [Stieleria tagensis]
MLLQSSIVKSFSLPAGLLAAAFGLAVLPGCGKQATTTVSEVSESADHDHDDHGDHAGHDHDKAGDHSHDDHGGHDHGDHDHDFESLAEAVEEITSLRDEIRDGFAAGDAEAAHGPLHHIGTVLIATQTLVEKQDPSEQKDQTVAAVKSLMDDYSAVDLGLHGSDESKSKGKSYDDVSASIDAAVETLTKASK